MMAHARTSAPMQARTRKRSWGHTLTVAWFIVVLGVVAYFHFVVPPFVAVPTGSMIPVLHIGDLAIVHPIRPAQVKVGEIIVVDLPKNVQTLYHYPPSVIHQVIRIEHVGGKEEFRTKGVANAYQDPYVVMPSYVRGVVVHAYRDWGYPILFMHSIQGRVFILIMTLLVLINEMWDPIRWRWTRRHHARLASKTAPPAEHKTPDASVALSELVAILSQISAHLDAQTALLTQMAEELKSGRFPASAPPPDPPPTTGRDDRG